MNSKQRGIIYLILSAALLGLVATLGKFIFVELNSTLLAFFRVALAALITLIFLWARKELHFIKEMKRKDFIILCIVGVFAFGVSSITFVWGIDLTTAAIGSLLGNMNRIFFVIFTIFLLKKPVTRLKILGITLAMIGVFFVVWNGQLITINFDLNFLIGVIFLIITAVLGGFYYAMNDKYVRQYNSLPILTIMFITSLLLITPLSIPYFPALLSASLFVIILLIVAGVACTAIPYFLFAESLKYVDPSTASSVSLTTPLFGIFFAVLFLGEVITIYVIIGAILILGGNLLTIKENNKIGMNS